MRGQKRHDGPRGVEGMSKPEVQESRNCEVEERYPRGVGGG